MKTFLLTLIAISSAPLPCSSSTSPSNRDINTYGSYSNPNVAYSHYWADANNVLQDLSSFKKLYVKYHGCAWSTTSYSTGVQEEAQDDYYYTESDVSQGCPQNSQQTCENCYYDAYGEKHYYTTNDQTDDQNNDNQDDQNNNQNKNQNDQNNNQNNNENDQENNQNDGDQNQNDGEGNDGERKKKRFLEDGGGQACGNKASSCDQWWGGVQSCMGANVAYSLYGILPGDATFNPCNRGTFINSFFTKDGLTNFVQASNGKIEISSLNQQCASNGNGYGTSTSCSGSGTFTVDTFNGGCYEQNYVATVDTLDTLNEALESEMNCMLIYSSDKGSTNYASNLLSESQQCSFDMDSCPDPHGLVAKYEYNFGMAQRYTKYEVPDAEGRGGPISAVFAMALGAAGVALIKRKFR